MKIKTNIELDTSGLYLYRVSNGTVTITGLRATKTDAKEAAAEAKKDMIKTPQEKGYDIT